MNKKSLKVVLSFSCVCCFLGGLIFLTCEGFEKKKRKSAPKEALTQPQNKSMVFEEVDFNTASAKQLSQVKNINQSREALFNYLKTKGNLIKLGDLVYQSEGALGGGEGGNGRTYVARNLRSSREYVLKVFKYRKEKAKEETHPKLKKSGKLIRDFASNYILKDPSDKRILQVDLVRAEREWETHTKLMELISEYTVPADVFWNKQGMVIVKKPLIKGFTLKKFVEETPHGEFFEKIPSLFVKLRLLLKTIAYTGYSVKSLNPANIIYDRFQKKWIIIDAAPPKKCTNYEVAYKKTVEAFKEELGAYKGEKKRLYHERRYKIASKRGKARSRIDYSKIPGRRIKLAELKKTLDRA